jgi:hypothetical protein
MKSESKAKLVTILLFVLILLLMADVVALWPWTLPWVLGVFAVPGAMKFCRVLYIWLTTEDQPVSIKLPFRKPKKPKGPVTYKDWADAQKGEQT